MPDDHLDDEQLSAVIDGHADGALVAHAAACPACTARLAQLRSAVALVASPIAPLPSADVDRAVSAAIAAAAVAPVAASADSQVVPMRTARRPAQWLAAVAAVAALVVGVPVLLRSAGGGDGDRAEVGASSGMAKTSGEAVQDSASASDGGDAMTTREALQAAPADAVAGTGGGGSIAALRYQEDLGDQDDVERLASTLRSRLSTGPTRPVGGNRTDEEAGDSPRCEPAARDVGAGRLGSLTYSARLRWRGEEAEVLAFALTEPTSEATTQAYVLALAGCGVLAEPRF